MLKWLRSCKRTRRKELQGMKCCITLCFLHEISDYRPSDSIHYFGEEEGWNTYLYTFS